MEKNDRHFSRGELHMHRYVCITVRLGTRVRLCITLGLGVSHSLKMCTLSHWGLWVWAATLSPTLAIWGRF